MNVGKLMKNVKEKKKTFNALTVWSFWPRCYTTTFTKAMHSQSGHHLYFIGSWTSASDKKTALFRPLNTVFHNKTVQCITTIGHMKDFKHSIYLNCNNALIGAQKCSISKNTPKKRTLVLWCCNTEKLKVKSCQRDNIWNYRKFLPFW